MGTDEVRGVGPYYAGSGDDTDNFSIVTDPYSSDPGDPYGDLSARAASFPGGKKTLLLRGRSLSSRYNYDDPYYRGISGVDADYEDAIVDALASPLCVIAAAALGGVQV